jgi:adenylate cyclase
MAEGPESAKVARKLAAFLAADIAGYSTLMGADDEATVGDLKAHQAVILPMIGEHGGRIIDTAGDGILAEFASVVNAVECAVAIQKTMAARNIAIESARRMQYRIGVNVGDVIHDEARAYGDGVNIAARLEALAEPGGICVSGRVLEDTEGKLEISFEDAGEQQLKNIPRSVRVYRVRFDGTARAARPLTLPSKPSIAVLPFVCLSEEQDFGLAADAMTVDLITMLARIPGFVVIARQSSFAYRTRAVDARQIGRELGVRYLVEGSIRAAGEYLRVGAQLIEAETGTQLWADRFEAQTGKVLDLEDQIARAIVSRIEPELVRAEIASIRHSRDHDTDAWSCLRRGTGTISLKGWSEETLAEATALLRKAATLDPEFALAHAQLALYLSWGSRLGLAADAASAVAEARTVAERAVLLDHDDSEVLGYAGCALAELGELERGAEILERAIENDPSNAQAWVALGTAQCLFEGNREAGLEKLAHGMRLSPRDHRLGFWGTFYSLALAEHGRSEEAYAAVRAACRRDPQFYVARVVLALVTAGLGKRDEAIAALREACRLRPRLSLDQIAGLVGRRVQLIAPFWNEISAR